MSLSKSEWKDRISFKIPDFFRININHTRVAELKREQQREQKKKILIIQH